MRNTISSIRSKRDRTKPNFNQEDDPGVHLIPCAVCSEKFIGQTGRALATRLKDHESYVRLANLKVQYSTIYHRKITILLGSHQKLFSSIDIEKRLIVKSAFIQHLPNFNFMGGVFTKDHATRKFKASANPDILNNLPPPI